jgi:hypothetical protein
MQALEVSLEHLEAEIREVKSFLNDELSPWMERLIGRRSLLLYSLRHPRLRLRNPIAVSLEDDGVQTIASAYDLDLFGHGETEGEALDDLRRTIVDLYASLKESADTRGPLSQQVWEYLSDVVEELSRP